MQPCGGRRSSASSVFAVSAIRLRSSGRFLLSRRARRGREGISSSWRLSRHALGLAVDVFEIVTDDGLRHVVARDYKAGDAVLLSVESWVNEAGGFRYLLTPGNDPRRHHDHFHFEARSSEEQRRVERGRVVSRLGASADLGAGEPSGPAL